MKDNQMDIEFEKQNQQTIDDFKVGMQVQVNLESEDSGYGNAECNGLIAFVEEVDHKNPSVKLASEDNLWFLPTELKILPQESQEHSQPKTQQSTQELIFTLDDLAKACDTSGIGSQKFLELQRALINLE